MNKYHRIRFKVELLEDCHSGSGLGLKGIVDDMQARDNADKPVVWGTTIKGILRNLAEELFALDYPLATQTRIISMFGTEGSEMASCLSFSGLHFPRTNECFKINFSTSREIYSRKPLNNTLRCIEMLAAGLKAECEAQLFGDEEDVKFLKLLLKRFVAIGGSRSRGKGRIRVSDIIEKTTNEYKYFSKSWKSIRVKLKTVAPLCLPKASVSGNIIDSESYVAGAKLKGAILTIASQIASDKKAEITESALRGSLSFGNAYPISNSTAGSVWKTVDVLPVPLSLVKEKASSSEAKSEIPWWAKESNSDSVVPQKGAKLSDKCLYENFELPKDKNYKRVKEEAYYALSSSDNGYFNKYQPDMISMLRNRTPVCRVNRTKDLRRLDAANLNKDEGSLFSTICLAENQILISDIFSNDRENYLLSVIEYLKNNKIWLHVGRGGQPVEIVDFVVDAAKNEQTKNDKRVILTLTSDCIIRDEALNFVEMPTVDDFAKLLGLDLSNVKLEALTEAIEESGFNSSARVRQPSKRAMKKGSVFVFEGNAEKLSSLFNKLQELKKSNCGIGEYQEDGFGRFVVNSPIHSEGKFENIVDDNSLALSELDNDEALLADAYEFVSNNSANLYKKECPTVTQWHFFKEKLECCKNQQDYQQFEQLIRDRVCKLGGKCWIKPLENAHIFDVHANDANKNSWLIYVARICCAKGGAK